MIDSVLVDSDLLIDLAHEDQVAEKYLHIIEKTFQLSISALTKMEILVGCRNKAEQKETLQFLAKFPVFEIQPNISKKATELVLQYNLSHNLLIPDALIAATAIEEKIPLASKNQRDFKFIKGLTLVPFSNE